VDGKEKRGGRRASYIWSGKGGGKREWRELKGGKGERQGMKIPRLTEGKKGGKGGKKRAFFLYSERKREDGGAGGGGKKEGRIWLRKGERKKENLSGEGRWDDELGKVKEKEGKRFNFKGRGRRF